MSPSPKSNWARINQNKVISVITHFSRSLVDRMTGTLFHGIDSIQSKKEFFKFKILWKKTPLGLGLDKSQTESSNKI